jgi:multicomponent K+:H+ antiporter subunit E
VRKPPILLMIGLLAMWLILQDSLAPAQIAFGLLLSVGATLALRAARPAQPRLHRPLVALRLASRVLLDIVRSNVAVARIILGLVRHRQGRSVFLQVPLELRDPHGLAVLAAIITSTPGTIWVDLTRDGRTLTLHVLDLQDEEQWVHTIKQRYEGALREIFE